MSDGKKECVQVVVRCRPPNKKETQEGRQSIVRMNCDTGFVELVNPKNPENVKGFTFDSVYDKDSTQRMVYDETAFPLVESVLEGFNGTIFAYGQTGCGKTWTMSGIEDEDPESLPMEERGKLRGIIPNSFEHIFNAINLKQANEENTCEFLVRASYLEIYNEEIRDLMSSDTKKKLELKETPEKGVFVKDLTFEVVENRVQIDQVLARGTQNRTVGSTLMNSASSRSHSIFGVVVEVNETDASGESHIRVGKLNLVDLAGSERQSKTGASGDTLKEGCKINLSLSALGNVISALVDGKGKHIPYRDSKLTRLLQDSLGGNTKTVMISAISPADYNYEETLSTLRYANRAKNIKNKPIINEDPKDTLLREYKQQIEDLKKMLEQQLQSGGTPPSTLDEGFPSSVRGDKKQELGQECDDAEEEGNGPAPIIVTTGETQVVEVEKIVEKFIPDPNVVAENRALQDYSDAVVEQRNRLGAELDKKEEEIERERREREGLLKKLKKLERSVLGKKNKETSQEQVDEAKKQREMRKAQLKYKAQQRKAAELRQAKEKAEEEKRLIEEECKNAHGVVEAKEKALRALKKSMIAKMDKVRQEMRDLEYEFQEERESLLETIREQTKEIKRLDQIVDMFLPPTERSKLWEQSLWDEEEGEWRLPKLKPRQGYKPLQLPGLNGEPPEGGAEVVSSPSKKRRGSKDKDKTSRKKDREEDAILDPFNDNAAVDYQESESSEKRKRRNSKELSKSRRKEEEGQHLQQQQQPTRPKSRRHRKKKTDIDPSDCDIDPFNNNNNANQSNNVVETKQIDGEDSQRPKSRRRRKKKEQSSEDLAFEWPTQDLPMEGGYGDRCQSRQGRRNRTGQVGGGGSSLDLEPPNVVDKIDFNQPAKPPRHLAPL